MIASAKSTWIKTTARELGFFFTGIAAATSLNEEARQLERWLQQGRHGSMTWMERYFDLRTDPLLLVPGARAVICLAHHYYPEEQPADATAPKVARYAYGQDYHRVLKQKLNLLQERMTERFGAFSARSFVDSGPVMERAWAAKAGLGWNGKNTLTIHPRAGSYFFLAVMICDLELEYDQPIHDHCGTCTRCIDACPTRAIDPQGYALDATKCISYLTIELREDQLPTAFAGKMENWVFGCDICQEVCPWNRFAQPHDEPAWVPRQEFLELTRDDYARMDEPQYERVFAGTPVKRPKWSGFKRNVDFVLGEGGEKDLA